MAKKKSAGGKKKAPKAQSVEAAEKVATAIHQTELAPESEPVASATIASVDPDDAAVKPHWYILSGGSDGARAIKATQTEAEEVRRAQSRSEKAVIKLRPALNNETDRQLIMCAEGDPDDIGPGPVPAQPDARLKLIEIKQRAIASIQYQRDRLAAERKRLGKEIERIEGERNELIYGQGALQFAAPGAAPSPDAEPKIDDDDDESPAEGGGDESDDD